MARPNSTIPVTHTSAKGTSTLATLKGAGLVTHRREGRRVYYRVVPRGIEPLVDWIAHYRVFWPVHVDRLEKLLEKMTS